MDGLVGPRAGLDDVEKRKLLNLLGLELIGNRTRDLPACRFKHSGFFLLGVYEEKLETLIT
jgi:hypothetical protein